MSGGACPNCSKQHHPYLLPLHGDKGGPRMCPDGGCRGLAEPGGRVMTGPPAELFMQYTPLASQAVVEFLDQFDFDTLPDPLADWLFGVPFDLDGGEPSYGSPELILGAAPVRPVERDLFQVDDAGTWAVLQPVATLDGAVLDLVTWHPCSPDRWRLLTGNGTALGEREIALRFDQDGPLEMFATPMSWHRAGGRGACLLRRSWQAAQRLFGGERELIAETEQLGDQLDQLLRFRPSPAILTHALERAA